MKAAMLVGLKNRLLPLHFFRARAALGPLGERLLETQRRLQLDRPYQVDDLDTLFVRSASKPHETAKREQNPHYTRYNGPIRPTQRDATRATDSNRLFILTASHGKVAIS